MVSSCCPNYTDTSSSIVEYATRDQAQQAIATLSNQSLMGRLVYVREVRLTASLCRSEMLTLVYRIERQNHASLDHQAVAISVAACVVVTKAHPVQVSVALWAALAVLAVVLVAELVDSFTSRMCVTSLLRNCPKDC